MFRKLRNRLILINLGITTLVIVATFATIYILSTGAANRRPPMKIEQMSVYSDDMESIIMTSIEQEKRAAAQDLLIMLIVAGVAIEVTVAIVSYFMAEEAIKPVREAYESQKIFIANASHEIKTPLAAISANLEAADIKGNHWISNVEAETAKLTALNSELLTLARTDLVNEVTISEVNLAEILDSTVQSFEPRMKDIEFKKTVHTSSKAKINAADFTQILSILMDNAVKYSDKKIAVSLDNHKLVVKNDGARIGEQELSHIFDRFYQVDKTREGVGLGLSIAKSLAERNRWKLTAESSKMTSFTLVF